MTERFLLRLPPEIVERIDARVDRFAPHGVANSLPVAWKQPAARGAMKRHGP